MSIPGPEEALPAPDRGPSRTSCRHRGVALVCGDVESLLALAIIGEAGLAVRIGAEER